MSLIPCCNSCGSTLGLSRCAACKVTPYCSRDHQVLNREKHAQECKAVKEARDVVQQEEKKIRDHPGDFSMPPNPFETSIGHFWDILDARHYLRARYVLVEALLEFETFDAVRAAADHLLDMLRLDRSDNMVLRDIIPNLLLRLGRDQQCYDFIKWWETKGNEGDHDYGKVELPYLELLDADVFESPSYLGRRSPGLSNQVAVALLKTKLLIDVRNLSRCTILVKKLPQELVDRVKSFVPLSSIIRRDKDIVYATDYRNLIETLSNQVEAIFQAITKANKYFWPALVKPGRHLGARPGMFHHGSKEEMQLKLNYCYESWLETPGAIELIKKKMGGSGLDKTPG